MQGQEASLEIRVVDSRTSLPLPTATIVLEGRDTTRGRTESGGLFRARLQHGSYALIVTRVGYEPARMSLGLARDTTLTVGMRTLGIILDTVRIYGRSRVIHGVVATRDLAPIGGARLELLGAKGGATTDSSGQFVLGTAEAESYVLRVARAGYATRLMSVSLQKDRSVELSITLDSTPAQTNYDVLVREFGRRAEWRGNRSAIVARDQLVANENAPLSEALRRAPSLVRKNIPLNGAACIFVNGVARPQWPLDAFDTRNVEAIEVHDRRSELTKTLEQSWPAGARCTDLRDNRPVTVGSRRPSDLYIVIWTRGP